MVRVENCLKICFNKCSSNVWEYINRLANIVHTQGYRLYYLKFFDEIFMPLSNNNKNLEWFAIIDVIVDNDTDKVIKSILEYIEENSLKNIDVFYTEKYSNGDCKTIGETIVSSYIWNNDVAEELRNKQLKMHFLLEERQNFYNYYSFQIVKQQLLGVPKEVDFFFDSQIIVPDGVNKIYSSDKLIKMRLHSQTFLDINSRCLSFGYIHYYMGGKNDI